MKLENVSREGLYLKKNEKIHHEYWIKLWYLKTKMTLKLYREDDKNYDIRKQYDL